MIEKNSLTDVDFIKKIEQELLSVFLCNKPIFAEFSSEIKPSDFLVPIHKQIFLAMLKIKDDGKMLDLTILLEFFAQHEDFQFSE
jgi:replicative DNA helicase